MAGIPAPLLTKLRETLRDCGPFSSDRILASTFLDERIAPWKDEVPIADRKSDRIELFLSDFLNRKNRAGQSILVLFLQVLHDQAEEEDECFQRIGDIAVDLAAAIGTELPPLARKNLWRASAVQAGVSNPTGLGGFSLATAEAFTPTLVEHLPADLTSQVFAERLESLKNKSKADWLPVIFLEKGLQAARAVGRVEHQGRKIGTAFLVAQELVLTNTHVMNKIPVLPEAGVRFNVGLDDQVQWRYFAEQIVHSPSDELDFSLVRLKDPATGTPLALSTEAAYPQQHANILQHPRGESMQVALRNNEIVHVEATRVYYVADTEGGSSGSPVFNDDWSVIALHRAGMMDDDNQPVKNANQGIPILTIEPIIRPYLHGGS